MISFFQSEGKSPEIEMSLQMFRTSIKAFSGKCLGSWYCTSSVSTCIMGSNKSTVQPLNLEMLLLHVITFRCKINGMLFSHTSDSCKSILLEEELCETLSVQYCYIRYFWFYGSITERIPRCLRTQLTIIISIQNDFLLCLLFMRPLTLARQ